MKFSLFLQTALPLPAKLTLAVEEGGELSTPALVDSSLPESFLHPGLHLAFQSIWHL